MKSPRGLYALAASIEEIVQRYLPDARVQYGVLNIQGVADISGSDLVGQLTPDELDIEPLILQMGIWSDEASVIFSSAYGSGSRVGYVLDFKGSSEVLVIGLAEKIGNELQRLAQQIDAGAQILPLLRPGHLTVSSAESDLSAVQGGEVIRPDSAQKSATARFFENPYTITIVAGLALWLLTNIPTVASGVSAAWLATTSWPWFGSVANIVGSLIAGALIAAAVGALRRNWHRLPAWITRRKS